MKKLHRNTFSPILISTIVLCFNINVFGQTYDVNISNSNAQTVTGWGGFPEQCGSGSVAATLAYDAEFYELGTTISRLRLWGNTEDSIGNIVIGNTSTGLKHIYAVWNEARNRGVANWTMSVCRKHRLEWIHLENNQHLSSLKTVKSYL